MSGMAANGKGLGDGLGNSDSSAETKVKLKIKSKMKIKNVDKSSSAGTEAEQRTTADNGSSASLLPNPMLCAALRPHYKSEKKRWWIITGLYYGYPICCIIDFCKRGYKMTVEQKKFQNGNGFIPCPTCAKKLLSKQVTIKKLLKDRICQSPFPKDDC